MAGISARILESTEEDSPAIDHSQRRLLILTDDTQSSLHLWHRPCRNLLPLHTIFCLSSTVLPIGCSLWRIVIAIRFTFFFVSLSLEPTPFGFD
jgi:hypothetical protein